MFFYFQGPGCEVYGEDSGGRFWGFKFEYTEESLTNLPLIDLKRWVEGMKIIIRISFRGLV